jgi:DNA-binding MarR family transcriptional regulator
MIDANRERELRLDVEALYFGYRAFTALPDRILGEQGLGRAHHRILYFVRREPGISIGDLLALLKVSKQAMNRPLRDLEALGLLSITPDAADKRIRRVRATRKGAQLEARLTGAQLRLLHEVFAGLDATTEARWREAMTRLAETDA